MQRVFSRAEYYFSNGTIGLGINKLVNPILSLSPDLWYDITDLSTMKQETNGAAATTAAVVDSPVGSWLSKGSQAAWLTAPNDGSRPTLRFSGTKGYYLEFTSGKSMTGTITALTNPWSGVAGVETTASDGSGYTICIEGGANGAQSDFAIRVPSPNTELFAGSGLGVSSHPNSTPFVFAGVANGGSSKARRNGGAYTTGNAGTRTLGTPLRLNQNAGGSTSWGHNNYGMVFWQGIKTDADLLKAEQVFAQQMGITLS